MSDSLGPHGLQHTWLPCPSLANHSSILVSPQPHNSMKKAKDGQAGTRPLATKSGQEVTGCPEPRGLDEAPLWGWDILTTRGRTPETNPGDQGPGNFTYSVA